MTSSKISRGNTNAIKLILCVVYAVRQNWQTMGFVMLSDESSVRPMFRTCDVVDPPIVMQNDVLYRRQLEFSVKHYVICIVVTASEIAHFLCEILCLTL